MERSGSSGGAVPFSTPEMAEAWRQSEARRAAVLRPATELMLDLAGIGPGMRVLDVGAGTGEQTLLAAGRIGPSGYLLATDISQPMLDLAARAFAEAGLTNVETRVADARVLDLPLESFDAAISRLAIMLIPDRQQALTRIQRALKPGGRFAAVVLGTAERNPVMARSGQIARRRAGAPPAVPGEPGMFALGAPGVFADELTRAGFRDVEVRSVMAPIRADTLDEVLGLLKQVSPAQGTLAQLPEAEQVTVWDEIAAALREFEGPNGFEAPREVLVGVGTK